MSDPFQGIGKPEALKYMESDLWSRRIDLEYRLLFQNIRLEHLDEIHIS
jgi:toxin YoeB